MPQPDDLFDYASGPEHPSLRTIVVWDWHILPPARWPLNWWYKAWGLWFRVTLPVRRLWWRFQDWWITVCN